MDVIGENHLFDKISLHYAAASGSLNSVKYLLKQGDDPNCKDDQNLTALHYAIRSGLLEVVKYIVEHGANVNQEGPDQDFPIHKAVEFGSLEIVKCLIEHGADVNQQNFIEDIPLHTAVDSGSLEIVKWLIQNGAGVNRQNVYQDIPLNRAVKSGSLEIVKCLIEHGADVNHITCGKSTPLYTAVNYGLLEIVTYLVEHGANVNHKNIRKDTPLHTAVVSGSVDIVNNADVNCGNNYASTSLEDAAKMRSLEMVAYPFEKSGKVRRNDDDTWIEILHLACVKGINSVVEYLLQRKVIKDINNCFGPDWSPLRTACYHGHTATVQTLLKYDVDIRKEEKLECGNDEIISILDMELKKSVRHREKIQLLKQMRKEKLVEVRLG